MSKKHPYIANYFNNYKRGVRDLSPYGEISLLKYNDETGCNEIVKKIENPKKERIFQKVTQLPFGFKWTINYLFTRYKFKTEDEWTRFAIKQAKEINCDIVEYYDEHLLTDSYRRTTLWSKKWKAS